MNINHDIPLTNIAFTELNALFFRSWRDGLQGDLKTTKFTIGDSTIHLYIAGAAKTSFLAQTG